MIKLTRREAPAELSDIRVQRTLNEAREFFGTDTRETRQRWFDFDEYGVLNDRRVIDALEALTAGRCAICSRDGASEKAKISPHRLRPAQDAVASDGSISRRHYWWLAYAWQNLFPACAGCQTAQGAKFPVKGDRVSVGSAHALLEREEPLLLDPCLDDPEQFFIYLESGEVVSRDARAKATIETFDLNRPELIDERALTSFATKEQIRDLARQLDTARLNEFADGLSRLYSKSSPFAALRRQLVNQWVQFRWRKVAAALAHASGDELLLKSLVGSLSRVTNRVKDEVAADFFGLDFRELRAVEAYPAASVEPLEARVLEVRRAPRDAPLPYLDAAEIHSVEIRNFRAIESLDLELTRGAGEGSWMMLLGENGAGKTSVLQAVALTLCDPETLDRLEVKGAKLLRHGTDEGHVKVRLTGSRRSRELHFASAELGVSGTPREGVLIAGYGATRLLPKTGSRRVRATTVENLFDPLSRRANPSVWLPRLPREQFDAVASALRVLLQLGDDEEILRGRKSGLEITRGKSRLELSELSDGYKAMAALALDLMQLFLLRWGSVGAAEGIVLIDELGAHLHPRWQMRVTESLRATFPRVQFIATTHDPLCLRGLHDGEVVVLRRSGRHIHALHDELPPIEGLTVDQLLTNEHFGLSSALDPAIEDQFTRYYDLLALRSPSEQEQRELGALSEQLEGLQLLGTSRRERLALEAVDESLAQERRLHGAADLAQLNESAKREVRALWEEVAER
jgi:uncharacterized protein (TIGR02646 family)